MNAEMQHQHPTANRPRRNWHRFAILLTAATGLALASPPAPAADSVVVFNEVHYHPATNEPAMEWVELHNQMAVDIDLSAWAITGGIDYTFPEGTVILGGGHRVVAIDPAALQAATGLTNVLGPFTGRLNNGSGTLRLRERNRRLMDELEYADGAKWPVAPDGSGATLAKRDPNLPSAPPENWTSSGWVNGTPGRPNFPSGRLLPELVLNEVSPGAGPGFFVELLNRSTNVVTLANYRLVLDRDGTNNLAASLSAMSLAPGEFSVLSNATFSLNVTNRDRLFLFGPSSNVLADAVEVTDRLRGRWPDGDGDWLFPHSPSFGGSNQVVLRDEIVINEIMYHPPPRLEVAGSVEPGGFVANLLMSMTNVWRYEQSGTDLGIAWREPAYDDSAWPAGAALFYATTSSLQAPRNTPLTLGPTTYYFRATFVYAGGPASSLTLRHIIDDGAVAYLNGVEFFRHRMPAGVITNGTRASSGVGIPPLTVASNLPAGALVLGTNVLAVEVHQAINPGNDVVFGAELSVAAEAVPLVTYAESDDEWLELHNRGTNAVNLAGWRLDEGIDYRFASNTVIAPGGFLVVAKDPAALRALHPGANLVGPFTSRLSRRGERIVLKDDSNNPADLVHYFDGGRWPEDADGGGTSLELRDPRADNAAPEAWAASDEGRRSAWRTYAYRGVAAPSFNAPAGTPSGAGLDTQWREFVLGLLDAGEVWLDDIRVTESPDTAPVQMIQNGTFDTGTNKWRIIGNHHGDVIDDPDQPGNKVLRLVASGATEHMSNHGETTLANNLAVVDGRTYEIAFRAKWIRGSRQLNTRLHFNRVARTTVLDAPTLAGTPGAANSRATTNLGPTFAGLRHAPAVPAAGVPVTVTVEASDPQGLGTIRLWYSVTGGVWRSTHMARSTGNEEAPANLPQGERSLRAFVAPELFAAILPGQPAATVVQFYVEAFDEAGARATMPAAGPASRALYKVNDGLAATNGLHNFRIVMRAEDANWLHNPLNAVSDAYLGCTVISDERDIFYDAGVRLKGSEVGRLPADLLGFFLRFPADQPFRGVHGSVGIERNGAGRGQREMLVHQAFQHAGGLPAKYHDLIRVITPKPEMTRAAELQLARYTDVFLDGQFEDGSDGMLFEYEIVYRLTRTHNGTPEGNKVPESDGWVGTTIHDLGGSKENYRWTYLVENNRARDDFSRLIPFTRALGQSGAALTDSIHRFIDVDQWLRAFAGSMLSGTSDTYGSSGDVHNGQFYVRPGDQKILFLPHDLDLFVGPDRPIVYGDLAKLVAAPAYARAYYRHLRDMLATTCNTNYMAYWVASFGRLLPEQNFRQHLSFYPALQTHVHSQINAAAPPVAFSITTSNGANFTVTTGVVELQGNGWLEVAQLEVNGVPYAVTWIGVTRWSITIPLAAGPNLLRVQGVDDGGLRRSALLDTIVVTNLGSAALRPVVINEWMADNAAPGGLADPADGQFQDWFELYNPNTVPIDLGGFHLTDELAIPSKWRIPTNTVIAPRGFRLVWADGNTSQNSPTNTDLHASFRLAVSGEAIGLFAPDGVNPQHIVVFPAQFQNVSQGLYPDGDTNSVRFMTNWTPRAANQLGGPPAPVLRQFTVDDATAMLRFTAIAGRTYRLEYTDDLNAPNWNIAGQPVTAANTELAFVDPLSGVAQRFYRLMLLP